MFDLHIAGGLARLVLNRPEARNAIPFSGWAELAAAVQQAEAAGAQMLVVSGHPGGSFCAGADMAAFHAFATDPDARTAFRLAIRQGLDALRDTPLVTLAVVEGHCYGAGVALAMACDTRFGGYEAEFAITPAKFGIAYPQEDVHRLVALLGPGQASRLLFGAQAIDSQEAVRIGLLDRAFAANVATGVDEFIKAVMANDPASLRTLKRGIRLAMAGVASDPEQDHAFDDLLGSETLVARLAARRK